MNTEPNSLQTVEYDRRRLDAEAAIEERIDYVNRNWPEMAKDFKWDKYMVIGQLKAALTLIEEG